MEEDNKKMTEQAVERENEPPVPAAVAPEPEKESGGGGGGAGGGGGWGWGFSPLSYISDLQKAAAVAAEEISRNVLSLSSLSCLSF